jgi:hypothetical protein
MYIYMFSLFDIKPLFGIVSIFVIFDLKQYFKHTFMIYLRTNYQMFSCSSSLGFTINPKTKYKIGYVYEKVSYQKVSNLRKSVTVLHFRTVHYVELVLLPC